MREILFRGKRVDNVEWAYGMPIKNNLGKLVIVESAAYFEEYNFNCVHEIYINENTVGQYTGLTDKNGKKIFEGDIVKGRFLFGMEVLSVVVFKDGAFGLEWHRGKSTEFDAFTSMCNVKYEVIGNIHDNPQILEE